MKSMLLTKLKIISMVLLVLAALGVDAGWSMYRGQAPEPDAAPKAPVQPERKGGNAVMTELEKLHGTWIAVSAEKQGNRVPEEELKRAELRLVIEGEEFTITTARAAGEGMKGKLKIDPAKKPKSIDLTAEVAGGRISTATGIYELDGDTLKLCYGKDRPTRFETTPDRAADQRSYVFKRHNREPA